MLARIIYSIRIFCSFLYVFLVYFSLNTIFQSGWQGVLFLIASLIFIIMTLISLLSQKEIFMKTISYNIVIIALTVYLAIVESRYIIDLQQYSSLYTLNVEYCKTNYIILGFVLIGIILNTIILSINIKEDKE